ncbi:MAG: 50S ribosomal protein L15 [SAR202 cluster bacterium]|nr:50S ribosomal protein L15 [SAR202 cluster bacterium]
MSVKQHNLQPPRGARRTRRRIGRGVGSGRGTYSGRGMKGQKSRSGSSPRTGMEGGQMAWIKGLPKIRGFKPPVPKNYAIVNLKRIVERFDAGAEVSPQTLVDVGLIRDIHLPLKILGDGEIPNGLSVSAHRFSANAKAKLLAAGCSVNELPETRRGKKGG